MPVTIKVSAHESEPWTGTKYKQVASPDTLLSRTLTDDSTNGSFRASKIVQSSFACLSRDDRIHAAKNGFVHACITAYNDHHDLVLRPEDVWFAILTQLSSYVNANANRLRSLFFDDSTRGSKVSLHIEQDLGPDLKRIDHGRLSYHMTTLMQDNMKDAKMRDWILPAFTTTTKADQAIASVIFMGTMQKFMTYSWGTKCGIPTITLLGEESDWCKIQQRLSRIPSFGPGPTRWHRLLREVLSGFVNTFRNPGSETTKTFWQTICNENKPNGSGTTTYSGWITVFCFWNDKGKCLHPADPDVVAELPSGQLPIGFVKVPMTLYDNGSPVKATMLAGSVGINASNRNNGDYKRDGADVGNTIQPESGWFIYRELSL